MRVAVDFGLMAKYSDTFRKGHIVLPVIFGKEPHT
jgi:hypothetical protein